MLSQRREQAAYVGRTLEGLLLCAGFLVAFEIRRTVPLPFLGPPIPLNFASHAWLLALAVPLYWALTRSRQPGLTTSRTSAVKALVVPFVYLGLLLGTAIFLLQAKTFSRAVFFLFLALSFGSIVISRLALGIQARLGVRSQSTKRVLLIGTSPDAMAFRQKIESHPEYCGWLVGQLAGPGERPQDGPDGQALGTLDSLKRMVEDEVVDDVVFVVPSTELPACERHIAWCDEVGVTVHLKADFVRNLVAKTYPTELDGAPMLTLASTPREPAALLLKRVIDVGCSATALTLLAPVLAAVAVVVRVNSRGPALFCQERVGLNGRLFRLYKFRSMYQNAEGCKEQIESQNEMSGPVFKMARDPRVTPVGRWLRKFSVDELPQLWNVLRGDMSLVGPRPPLADEVRRYQRWQRRRLSMKPGITCLWQVKGRNRIQFEDWMRLDLEYIDNWSLLLDFKILLRTFPAVVLARGAR